MTRSTHTFRLNPRARAKAMAKAVKAIAQVTRTSEDVGTQPRGYWTRALMGQAELYGAYLTLWAPGERRWRVYPHPILERAAVPVEYVMRPVTSGGALGSTERVFCKLIWRPDDVAAWRAQYLDRIATDLTQRYMAAPFGSAEAEILAGALVELDHEMETKS